MGLAAAGAVIGVVGAFVQAITSTLAGVDVPIGALAAVTMTALAVRAGAALVHRRAGAVAVAVGWVATVLWMSLFPSNEGDVIIGATTSALIYVYGGVLVAVFATVFPVRAATSNSQARP